MKITQQIIKLFLLVFFLNIAITLESHSSDNKNFPLSISAETNYFYEGKKSLDNGQYEKAISLFTISYEKLPILADYALLWRSEAYEKKGDIELAIEDLRQLREDFKDSSFIKNARKKEVHLNLKLQSQIAGILLRKYINDYPNDMDMKYLYATLLKSQDDIKEAKNIFKEIFISNSHLANAARKELSDDDITIRDIIKKGQNLNKAYLFKESEKYFREALNRKGNEAREDILKGLADSLFRQKRYKESAELYKKINNHFWFARSLLRTGDLKAFESELKTFKKIPDSRIGNVLISYGNRKRRSGDNEAALKIFKEVSSRHVSLKEEALWATGWTYYMMRDYGKAYDIFSQLHTAYSDSRYAYWKAKSLELSDNPEPLKVSIKKDINERDYYTMLYFFKNKGTIPLITNAPLKITVSSTAMQKVDILRRLGFRKEAVNELIHLSKKNNDLNSLHQISLQLKELSNYKMSINMLSRDSYKTELHELFYPLAYWKEIQEASNINNIDPYLIISVMREESRFDEEARSIAGAIGLMQLMPQTASRLNHEMGLTKNPLNLYNSKVNIMLGSYYLKNLLMEFKSLPAAIAAYNAGENAVRQWLKSNSYISADEFIEDIPFDETRNYVKKVLVSYLQYQRTVANSDPSAIVKTILNQ